MTNPLPPLPILSLSQALGLTRVAPSLCDRRTCHAAAGRLIGEDQTRWRKRAADG